MTPAGTFFGSTALFASLVLSTASAQAGRVSVDIAAGSLVEANMLETSGQLSKALELLTRLAATTPADFRVLFSLERVLVRLDRRADMLPFVVRGLAQDSTGIGMLGIAVRTFGGLMITDSARKYADRWASKVPGDATPYRTWADAASDARDRNGTIEALRYGQEKLGKPGLLSGELAQAYQQLGNYTLATQQWLVALRETPTYRSGAVLLLGQAPPAQRATVSQVLAQAGTADATRLHGLLLTRWGNVAEGTVMVRTALPGNNGEALSLLGEMLDLLRAPSTRDGLLAKATILEAISQRELGPNVLMRRLDAARAYAEAGSDRDARRLLALVSGDPLAPKGISSSASAALLTVMISEGRAAEAEELLKSTREGISDDERAAHTRRIAMLWAYQGKFDRAEALVRQDSTIAGIDAVGRIRLFRGQLGAATEALRYAGPFDDSRSLSVSRLRILALLQAVAQDSSPALGAAFLALETHDSTRALALFDSLATTFPPAGAAEARLLAGQIAVGKGDTTRALTLFTAADLVAYPGAAAAARLTRAQLLAALGKRDEARALIENLIIDFPESAVLPDARHLRDELRGAVPKRVP